MLMQKLNTVLIASFTSPPAMAIQGGGTGIDVSGGGTGIDVSGSGTG